jgi:hypothetical protein
LLLSKLDFTIVSFSDFAKLLYGQGCTGSATGSVTIKYLVPLITVPASKAGLGTAPATQVSFTNLLKYGAFTRTTEERVVQCGHFKAQREYTCSVRRFLSCIITCSEVQFVEGYGISIGGGITGTGTGVGAGAGPGVGADPGAGVGAGLGTGLGTGGGVGVGVPVAGKVSPQSQRKIFLQPCRSCPRVG